MAAAQNHGFVEQNPLALGPSRAIKPIVPISIAQERQDRLAVLQPPTNLARNHGISYVIDH